MSKSDKWLSECDCKDCDCNWSNWCREVPVSVPRGEEPQTEPGCSCCERICTQKQKVVQRRWKWIHDLDLDHDAENDVVPRMLLSRNRLGECQVAGSGRAVYPHPAHTCPHAPYIYRHIVKWHGIKFDQWTSICLQHLRQIFRPEELERKLQRADAAWAYRHVSAADHEPMEALRYIIGTIRAGIAERAKVGELDA